MKLFLGVLVCFTVAGVAGVHGRIPGRGWRSDETHPLSSGFGVAIGNWPHSEPGRVAPTSIVVWSVGSTPVVG